MNTTKVDTAPLTPDEAAQLTQTLAQSPGVLPPKFKSPEDFVKAYNELEAAFTRSRQERQAATTQPPATQKPPFVGDDDHAKAGITQTTEAPVLQIDTTPPKQEEVWTSFRTELAAGNVSDATLTRIKSLGIPDDILNDALQGMQAHRKTVAQQASAMVGGDERLQQIFAWAKTSLPKGQLEYINAGLGKTDTWQAALSSLLSMYEKQANPTNGNPAPIPGVRVSGTSTRGGFASQEEMTAAMRDPRYQYDASYQAEVWQRVGQSMG